MNGPASYAAAHKIICGKQTGAVHRIANCDIDENDLKYDEYANHEYRNTDSGNNPGDFWTGISRPTKNKKANWDKKARRKATNKSPLRLTKALCFNFGLKDEPEVCNVANNRDADTNGDG